MRKQWTAKTEVTDSLVQFRLKRKWQIALRRYVLGKSIGSQYAPFFAIDNQSFRAWIALQFDIDTNWENFSKLWQFDHIVPVTYFDFTNQEDMKLCWNFVNIRVGKLQIDQNPGKHIDVLGAKTYFEVLFEKTNYDICKKMIEKIEAIERSQIGSNEILQNFILERKAYLDTPLTYTSYEFDQLNTGVSFEKVEWERAFLKNLGKQPKQSQIPSLSV